MKCNTKPRFLGNPFFHIFLYLSLLHDFFFLWQVTDQCSQIEVRKKCWRLINERNGLNSNCLYTQKSWLGGILIFSFYLTSAMSCRVLPFNLFAGGATWPLHGHQKVEPRLALGRGCAQGCGNGLKCARHEWGGGRAWGRKAHTLDRGVTWGERKRLPAVTVLTGLTLGFTEAVFITGQSSAMFLFFSFSQWVQSDGYHRNWKQKIMCQSLWGHNTWSELSLFTNDC